ncbi:MAG: hypothetical protein HQL37_16305, partial [Alphaproteobacteria bacterium]|nr:hypothetical protein [Alphaproteobacteria bacterium]
MDQSVTVRSRPSSSGVSPSRNLIEAEWLAVWPFPVMERILWEMGIPFTDLPRLGRPFGSYDGAIWRGADGNSLLREPVKGQPS